VWFSPNFPPKWPNPSSWPAQQSALIFFLSICQWWRHLSHCPQSRTIIKHAHELHVIMRPSRQQLSSCLRLSTGWYTGGKYPREKLSVSQTATPTQRAIHYTAWCTPLTRHKLWRVNGVHHAHNNRLLMRMQDIPRRLVPSHISSNGHLLLKCIRNLLTLILTITLTVINLWRYEPALWDSSIKIMQFCVET